MSQNNIPINEWKTRFYQQVEENKKLQKINEQLNIELSIKSGRLKDKEKEIFILKKQLEEFKKNCTCENSMTETQFHSFQPHQVSRHTEKVSYMGENLSEISSSYHHKVPLQFKKNSNPIYEPRELDTFYQKQPQNSDQNMHKSQMSIPPRKLARIKQLRFNKHKIFNVPHPAEDDAFLIQQRKSYDIKDDDNEQTEQYKSINFSVFYDFNHKSQSKSPPKRLINQHSADYREKTFHLAKNISIQQIESISKEQNSPIDSDNYSSDQSSSLNERQDSQSSNNSRKDFKLPNGSPTVHFKNKHGQDRRVANQDTLKFTFHDMSEGVPNVGIASPFKMSRKKYKPPQILQHQEDLQRSIMGISIKEIQSTTHRESLIIKQSPRKLTDQVKQLQGFMDKNDSKLLQEFFIIGIDKDKVQKDELSKEVPLEPQNLYMFNHEPGKSTCQRRLVVKDFCFPNGVQIRKLKTKRANKILYGQQANTKENCFVFTLQAQDMDDYDPNIKDEYFYCIALVFEEIIEGNENQFYTSQKAFCIMSQYKYFELHLSILNTILSFYKLERFSILGQMQEDPSANSIQRELRAMLQVPLVHPQIQEILQKYSSVNINDTEIDFSNPILKSQVNYKIPQTPKDQHVSDLIWFSPMFLSALTAQQFYQILCAIMLEKSVVFVSDNLPLLSSAVLGMQSFLQPFKWCYVQIPILPRSLVDMIEAPMPFLVGLLKSHIQFVPSLNESQPFEEDGGIEKLIVYINDEQKAVSLDTSNIDIPLPSFKELMNKLVIPFSILNSASNYIYNPSEKQKQALKDIQDLILSTLTEQIANNLPQKILSNQQKVYDPKTLADHIRDNSRPGDKKFMEQFANTQMLIHYLEQKYCYK